MKRSELASFLLATGVLFPFLANAGLENAGSNFLIIYILAGILIGVLYFLGVAGLVARWLNSRTTHPDKIVDYFAIPLSALSLIFHGFAISYLLPVAHLRQSGTYEIFQEILFLVISCVATFVPRSWLAKFPAKKTKK